jgi:hypothetical protein
MEIHTDGALRTRVEARAEVAGASLLASSAAGAAGAAAAGTAGEATAPLRMLAGVVSSLPAAMLVVMKSSVTIGLPAKFV